MAARFEELDWRQTPMGEISLRRRRDPVVDREVYEVKLGDEYLMSSLFTVAEIELARLALAELSREDLDVVVGGLGLGYTAHAVLRDRRVRSMIVVEALADVIGWHQRGLVPGGEALVADPRCRLVAGDFFALTAAAGPDPAAPGRRFDAVLVDIDHSPGHVLHPSHAACYRPDGLRRLASHLRPGGVFALWSDDPPEAGFTEALGQVFPQVRTEVVTFRNPLIGSDSANTVYLAQTQARPPDEPGQPPPG
ncbi:MULTISPECIES: spermidine synthase [unclassified Micromonospora]|uniref:spermidine synthase n=2 Tax=unclassified Micromonospora TaxID=2617518 RepID=UPI003A844441